MNCQNAQELISVLYDGEPVPTEFADHVETCQTCRENLRAYSEIGAELRLLASRSSSSPVLPPSVLYQGRSRGLLFSSFMDRIPVPKFAVAAAAGVLLVMTVGLMRVHAQQSNPLWFQFTLTEKGKKADFTPQNLAQAGYVVLRDRRSNTGSRDRSIASGRQPETPYAGWCPDPPLASTHRSSPSKLSMGTSQSSDGT